MCGIVGFINAEPLANKYGDTLRYAFEQLLYADVQRGADGTGVLAVNGIDLVPTVHKSAQWSPDYLWSHSYLNMIKPKLDYAKAVIGHNRASTKAGVSNANAHPFNHKHITLVHNGVIPDYNSILPKNIHVNVDSAAAAYMIAEHGETEGLSQTPFKGVLVWWNDEDKTLNVARNEHRELWCVPIRGRNTLFYASEWRMLDWVLERSGLEPESKYKLFTPWQHFKFDTTKPKEWTRSPFVNASSQKTRDSRGTAGMEADQQGTKSSTANTDTSKAGEGTAANNVVGFPKRPDQVTEAEVDRVVRMFGNLSAKDRRKYNIPDSRPKIRKLCARINNAGLESYFGQRFVVYPDAFIPYKNQKGNGVIVGVRRGTDVRVEIPNCQPSVFDELKKDKWKFATVVNAKKSKTGKWHLIAGFVPLDTYKDKTVEEQVEEENDKEEIMLPGPNGNLIPLSTFQAMTANGCGNCDGFVNPNHAKDMIWFAGSPICHMCSCDPQVAQSLGYQAKAAIH